MALHSQVRLFVALIPSVPTQEALAQLAEGCARANWIPASQLHMTLRFIGEVPQNLLPEIEMALEKVKVQPFFLAAEGVGRFPPRGQPGVVWAGLGTTHPLLHQLRQQVDDRLLAAGLSLELRSFVPHVTLARTKESSAGAVDQWLKRHRDFAGPVWRVQSFHLMASELTPAGTDHRVVKTFPLGD